ncbi:hypothetical protein BCR39DRAFT_313078 [Naematelia encephala]|uniref:Zn(2)-C6 fungal-type domain-containing protein n=1 Tax=Naematelia encephala TaxID=71784 RepID=A0A1Y2AQM0_9TREE|nr:hypothetical protein BCR39DRAFT_313078 [Naematelia encephala]
MPVACRRCRQLKVKCLVPPDHREGQPCQRCVRASLDCVFENHQRGRKPGFRLTDRSRALSRLKSAYRVLHAQDTDSRDLLASPDPGPSSRRNSQQFHLQSSFRPPHSLGVSCQYTSIEPTDPLRPPAHASFLPTYSDMEPSHRSPSSLREFFASICGEVMGEPVEALDLYRQDPVACGYMSEEEARQLFEDFHERIGPAIELLDPLLHTHDWVRNRSQFLYTTIIAVALKFSHDPDIVLLGRCQALAQDQLLRTFVDGLSSVESAQALLLLTEYKEPEDKSMYLLVGLACRIGMDLGLGNTPTSGDERMNRNYTRTWLALFCADQR